MGEVWVVVLVVLCIIKECFLFGNFVIGDLVINIGVGYYSEDKGVFIFWDVVFGVL